MLQWVAQHNEETSLYVRKTLSTSPSLSFSTFSVPFPKMKSRTHPPHKSTCSPKQITRWKVAGQADDSNTTLSLTLHPTSPESPEAFVIFFPPAPRRLHPPLHAATIHSKNLVTNPTAAFSLYSFPRKVFCSLP